MVKIRAELRSVHGTESAIGWADGHAIIVDRPEGKAGGGGLGFNGAQLLALAIGGCFCNDLRDVAHEMNVSLGEIAIAVEVELEGSPPITTSATMEVSCETLDGSDPEPMIEKAKATCMVSNSLRQGIPVSIQIAG